MESLSKSYVSRILRLALLAPDLVEAILGGWVDQRVMLEKLEWPLPVGWAADGSSPAASSWPLGFGAATPRACRAIS